jgi:hypothetical protein
MMAKQTQSQACLACGIRIFRCPGGRGKSALLFEFASSGGNLGPAHLGTVVR